MKKLRINTADNALIRAYFKWCRANYFFPSEYECSKLIEKMEHDHRNLVENFLNELKLQENHKEKYRA